MAKANNKELENFIKNSLDVRISANRDYVDDNYINITVKLFMKNDIISEDECKLFVPLKQ